MSVSEIIVYLNTAILIYFVLLASWYTFALILAYSPISLRFKEATIGHVDQIMQRSDIPLTVIVPAYNEETRILNAIYSILNSQYKNVHIIVVNDGSTDKTMSILIEEFSLVKIPPAFKLELHTTPVKQYYQSTRYPNFMVIDKDHSPDNNAADAHNAAINITTTPLAMTVDADTVLEPDAIGQILFTYLSNKGCVAVGGAIYVLNDNQVEQGKMLTRELPKKFVPALQAIEYLRSFTYGRAGFDLLSGALCFPGAFTLFETKIAREFGGFDVKNFAYDTEITLKFHHQMRRKNYPTHVRFSPSAISWTTVPNNLKSFWKQRDKWQRGMLLSSFKHIGMFFNPRYGIVGLISFPSYLIFEVFAPVVEFFAYILLVFNLFFSVITWSAVGWYILLAWSYLVLLTVATFYLCLFSFDIFNRFHDLLRVLGLVTLEMFGFRQVRAAACFWGTVHFFMNRLRGKSL